MCWGSIQLDQLACWIVVGRPDRVLRCRMCSYFQFQVSLNCELCVYGFDRSLLQIDLSFHFRPVVITGCAFSVLGVILLFIGTILDGVFYGVMENLDTCYSRYTNEIYGDSSYSPYAKACAVDHSQDCSCITSDNTDDCYLFDLKAANDCGEVLTTLPSDLLASMFFCLLLLIVVFTYSIFTCMTVCCSPENDVYIQDNNNGPAPGSQPPVAAAYPHYAQQQTPVAQAYVQPPPTVKAVPATTSTTNPMARAGDV